MIVLVLHAVCCPINLQQAHGLPERGRKQCIVSFSDVQLALMSSHIDRAFIGSVPVTDPVTLL